MNLAIVDFECTSLKSDQGFLLCGGIKPLGKPGKVYGLKQVKPGATRARLDHKLALLLRDEMEQFDGWITWNGLMFDLTIG